MRLIESNRGVSVVAVMISIFILAALGVGVVYFTALNQEIRIQEVTRLQAFYSSQAGLEYGLSKVIREGSSDLSFSFGFAGSDVTVTRVVGRMKSLATKHNARAEHSIEDPVLVDESGCILFDVSSARLSNKQLRDIEIWKNPECQGELAITALTGTTWEPDNGEVVTNIQFGGNVLEYSSPPDPPQGSGGVFDFSNNPYIIAAGEHHVFNFIKWNQSVHNHDFHLVFHYTYDGEAYTKTIDLYFQQYNQGYCLIWNKDNARLSWSGDKWQLLTGTTIYNQCDKPLYLNEMTFFWVPTVPERYLNMVKIDGTTIYSGSAGSAVPFAVDYSLGPNETKTVDYISFSDEMLGRNYTGRWTFVDDTENESLLNLFSGSQASCLDIDVSAAKVDPNYPNKIIGLAMTNTCASDIGMTDISLGWNSGSMTFTGAQIFDNGGSNTYSFTATNGELVSFEDNDLYLRNEDSTKDIAYLSVGSDIVIGTEFTLRFIMSDGGERSVAFTPSLLAKNLSISTGSAFIGGIEDVDLIGITLTNTGSTLLVLDKINISWLPVSSVRLIEGVTVGGADVWSGSEPTGSLINLSDVVIGPSEVKNIDLLHFDGDMSGRSFTIDFILLDESSATVSNFSPPDG